MAVPREKLILKGLEIPIIRTNRRSVAICVDRCGNILIRSPFEVKTKALNSFAQQKMDWIIKTVEKQKKRKEQLTFSDKELCELKARAEAVIPQRVEYFSRLVGLKPSAVKINFAKTRFGSCSAKNSLNFSAFLMLYPDEAIDYVVVHELAHIKHHNHSKDFYSLIEKYMPDYKERAKLLKK